MTPRSAHLSPKPKMALRPWLFWAAFALGVVPRWLPVPVTLVIAAQLACLACGIWLVSKTWPGRREAVTRYVDTTRTDG